jgi:hypothetical protein
MAATIRWRENQGDERAAADADEQLAAVLNDRTPAGDEAVAYLLTLYLGEHPDEELRSRQPRTADRAADPRVPGLPSDHGP